MNFKIAVIKGDGIGPEIVSEAMKVLDRIGEIYGHHFHFTEVLAGGIAIDTLGTNLPVETLEVCKSSDAVLLGAVGGPQWDGLSRELRPEKALLNLRKELRLYSNIRPARIFESLKDTCPLKPEKVVGGLDLVIVRELTGGIYFGKKYTEKDYACDCMEYHKYEIERIVHQGFKIAQSRNKKLCSVDKSNVLETSRLWRNTVNEISASYTDVAVDHLYVDNAAMQLIVNPKQFDVIVTENMFGDILSDAASVLTGSIGLLPSASLGNNNFGMYEPIHGSAPNIAGQNIANPLATILSTAMMLQYSFGLSKEAQSIEAAVTKVLDHGYRTLDIANPHEKKLSTMEMGTMVVSFL